MDQFKLILFNLMLGLICQQAIAHFIQPTLPTQAYFRQSFPFQHRQERAIVRGGRESSIAYTGGQAKITCKILKSTDRDPPSKPECTNLFCLNNRKLCFYCSKTEQYNYKDNCLACWKFNGNLLPVEGQDQFSFGLEQKSDTNSAYYYFNLIIKNVHKENEGNYSCSLTMLEYGYSHTMQDLSTLQVKDSWIQCSKEKMMEVQYDNDGNQAKIYCKAYGAPPLHFQFQWYRITGRNKTKLSGNYNANQGSSIINVLPIDRRKVEQTGKIICIARNTLIKDSQCQYQGNVNPLDDATWMVTLISILGSGTLTLCIIGVLLKVTRNQTITGLARTLVTILSREVLIIQTQPFLTEDIEEFRKEIGATYKARVFYIDNTTAWADMRTVVANLKRFKVVICIISKKILHEGVSNLQFKDFLCKIITKCIEKENVTGMPPILILKKEEFNHSHYPDDVDQLECIDIHLKDEQFQQLLKSHLTNEQIQWLEDHFTDQQFKQLLKIYYNDQSFQLLRENCLTHEQFLMLLVSHLDDDQYQQLLKTQLTGEQIQYLEDHLNQRQLRQWLKNYFTNQQLQILQESRLSTDQELQQLVENQLTDDLLQSFLQTRLTDEQIQWLKDHLTPQQLKQLLKNYSINRQFQPLLIALLTNEQLELLLQSHLIDDQFQQLLKNSLTSQQIQWLENHLADQQSKQFQQVQTNRLSTEQFRQLTESHLTHDQYEQLLESFARFYYSDWKD